MPSVDLRNARVRRVVSVVVRSAVVAAAAVDVTTAERLMESKKRDGRSLGLRFRFRLLFDTWPADHSQRHSVGHSQIH